MSWALRLLRCSQTKLKTKCVLIVAPKSEHLVTYSNWPYVFKKLFFEKKEKNEDILIIGH